MERKKKKVFYERTLTPQDWKKAQELTNKMDKKRDIIVKGGKISHHKPKPRGYSMFNEAAARRLG